MVSSTTTIEHDASHISINALRLPTKAANRVPREAVDLPLTLSESHILEAAHSQYLEYLDGDLAQTLDIESVLVICWLLVVHGFSPVRSMYLEFHPGSNLCYVDKFQSGSNFGALEFSAERSLKDLVRDFCLLKAGSNPVDPDDVPASNEMKHFLTSAIRYAGGLPNLQEAPPFANSDVMPAPTHSNCSVKLTSAFPDLRAKADAQCDKQQGQAARKSRFHIA